MADPLEELRATIRSAADALGDGAPVDRADPRAAAEARAGRLLDQRGDAAGARPGASRRGRSPSGCARSSASGWAASAERVEVAGPGFVNLFLADRWHRESVAAMLDAGEPSGAGSPERPERVLVEFVSANPTGPLTVAAGRGAAYGDSLARLLELAGHEVEREYYLNDTGGQVRRFAESIAARMQGGEPPEDGYRGEYVAELARRAGRRGRRARRPGRARPARHRGDARADRGDAGALRRALRHLVLGALAARGGQDRGGDRAICERAATSTRARARSGCGRPSSATTRTAC